MIINGMFVVLLFLSGLVSKSTSKVEEKGAHEKGARTTGAQRSPSELQRRTHSSRGAQAKGARQAGEEVPKSSRTTTAKARGEGNIKKLLTLI